MGTSKPFSFSSLRHPPKALSLASVVKISLLLSEGKAKCVHLVSISFALSKASCCSSPQTNFLVEPDIRCKGSSVY